MFSNQGSHGWIAKRLSTVKRGPESELCQVVEAISVPLVLLDKELRVVLANRAFSEKFQVSIEEMENYPIYEWTNGSWDVSQLQEPLEKIARGLLQEKEFDIDHQCPTNGNSKVLVSASRVGRGSKSAGTILLRFEDVEDACDEMEEEPQVAEELKKAEERIAELQAALEAGVQEREKAEAEQQKAREELREAEEQIAALKEAKDKESCDCQGDCRKAEAEEQMAALKEERDKESHHRQEVEAAHLKASEELKKAEERIAEYQEELVKLQREVDDRSKVDEVNRQTAENLIRAEGRLAELEVTLQKELDERHKLEEASRQARENLRKAEARLADLHSANQRLQKEITARKKSKDTSKESQKLTEKQFKEVRKDFQNASEQLQKELADSKLAEKALRGACRELNKTKEHLETIIKNSPDPVISTDRFGNVVLFNKGAEDLLGYRAEDVLGNSIWELYANEEQAREVLSHVSENGREDSENETILKGIDGCFIPVLVSASTVTNQEGNEAGTIWFKKDLRERKDLEEKIKEFAEGDTLTNLYNRVFFAAKLKEEFHNKVYEKIPLSLMVLGIDDFRSVNEEHGHQGGDSYLKALAGFVVRSVRPSDIVARYGGDELAVMLPGAPSSAAEAVAERLRETVAGLEVPFGHSSISCTISIGTVTSDSGSFANANDFLKAADKALYAAKHDGRNKVVVGPAAE